MQIVSAALLVVFLLISAAVGVRLVALHTRTRRPPELLIGIGILGIGPGGMGGLLAAAALDRADHAASPYAAALAVLAIVAGLCAAGLFNWRVYRPESERARLAVLGLVLLSGIGFGIELGTTAFADPLRPGPGVMIVSLCCAGTLVWGGAESIRYWRLMRRRLAIGLADPLVTNRFLLYGLGIGAAGIGSAISIGAQLVSGLGMAEMPLVTLSNSIFGLASAVCMGTAFLPPAAWRRRVTRGAS
jgi:hypothetical protein